MCLNRKFAVINGALFLVVGKSIIGTPTKIIIAASWRYKTCQRLKCIPLAISITGTIISAFIANDYDWRVLSGVAEAQEREN